MSRLGMDGRKFLKTFNNQFQEKYSFLFLVFFKNERDWENAPRKIGGEKFLPMETPIIEIREGRPKKNSVSIVGRTLVKNFEANFYKHFGIYVRVCYMDKYNKIRYPIGSISLSALQKLLEMEAVDGNVIENPEIE